MRSFGTHRRSYAFGDRERIFANRKRLSASVASSPIIPQSWTEVKRRRVIPAIPHNIMPSPKKTTVIATVIPDDTIQNTGAQSTSHAELETNVDAAVFSGTSSQGVDVNAMQSDGSHRDINQTSFNDSLHDTSYGDTSVEDPSFTGDLKPTIIAVESLQREKSDIPTLPNRNATIGTARDKKASSTVTRTESAGASPSANIPPFIDISTLNFDDTSRGETGFDDVTNQQTPSPARLTAATRTVLPQATDKPSEPVPTQLFNSVEFRKLGLPMTGQSSSLADSSYGKLISSIP